MITFGSDVVAMRLGVQALKTMYCRPVLRAEIYSVAVHSRTSERYAHHFLLRNLADRSSRSKERLDHAASHCLPAPSRMMASSFSSRMPLR